jgi:Response regulator containing CheY-like receiver, AAA-type ATPase, and DNA-binding domains
MGKERPIVFISYSTEDSVFADLAKLKLNAANIDVWMDQDKLNAGEEWRNEIDLGIINADALILILTPESCNSSYVTYEWAFAIGRKKKVIPLLYKTANIHPRISVLQYLDFTNQRKGPWDQLFNLIEKSNGEIDSEPKSSNLVGGMTVDDFKQLLSGAVSLANATAKTEGRSINQGDISEAATNLANANINLEHSDSKSVTILWVDDRPKNNVYEREAFASLGFKFDLALSTDEALKKLMKKNYSAIISDMGRVEGPREGYVLLEKVRQTDRGTPYFIYAGSNSSEHKKEAEKRGAQGTTNSPHELIEMVTKYVSVK